MKRIDEKFERNDLSYFELNLETWRQFWRVLEMSDILLCVVDIRFPVRIHCVFLMCEFKCKFILGDISYCSLSYFRPGCMNTFVKNLEKALLLF